jgi:hypothetical protein
MSLLLLFSILAGELMRVARRVGRVEYTQIYAQPLRL